VEWSGESIWVSSATIDIGVTCALINCLLSLVHSVKATFKAGVDAHRIEQLSGGEKSLVAIALIFAIQRYASACWVLIGMACDDDVDLLDLVSAPCC
jgi:hypothetical protein